MRNKIRKFFSRRLMPAYWKWSTKSFRDNLSAETSEALENLGHEISYNKYGGYCVPFSSRHRPAAQKILCNKIYEPKTIEYMIKNCGRGDIVHAGTYFGDFVPALSRAAAADAKVWAFEPNPENYLCAKITIEINGLKNVVLTNAGLGDKHETVFMQTVDEDGRALGGASQIIPGLSRDDAGSVPVKIVRVDDSVDPGREVSILQLDVEGHLKEALSGSLETIRRCLPIIILEVFPDRTLLDSDWFSENILSLGYSETDKLHENAVFSRSK